MFFYIKKIIRHQLNRQKFAHSFFRWTCSVSKHSKLGLNTVLFDNVSIIDSSIGDFTYIQKDTVIVGANIGKYCSIASDVAVGLAEHPLHFISTSPVFYDNSQPLPKFFVDNAHPMYQSETIIGHDVWIGQGVLIKSGITIGHGAVLAAGTVVTKDVDSYSVVAGVPAKHIKWRFDEEVRKLLYESEWWDLSPDNLKSIHDLFEMPIEFCCAVRRLRK